MKAWLQKQWEGLKKVWPILIGLAAFFCYSTYLKERNEEIFASGIGVDTTLAVVVSKKYVKSGRAYYIQFRPNKKQHQVEAILYSAGGFLQIGSQVPIQYQEDDEEEVKLLQSYVEVFQPIFICRQPQVLAEDTITTFDPVSNWEEANIKRIFSKEKPALELESLDLGQKVQFGFSSRGDTIYERRMIHRYYRNQD